MYYTIYKTTCLENNKIYIGQHQTTNLNDNYIGSGKALKNAIKKYGKEKFKKEILFIFENYHDMNEKEKELVTIDFMERKDTYNLKSGGENGYTHNPETIEKIRLSAIKQAKKESKGVRSKRIKKSFTHEVIQKMSIAKLGKPSARKNYIPSENTKQKISKSVSKFMKNIDPIILSERNKKAAFARWNR
jgi:hypothetical protein